MTIPTELDKFLLRDPEVMHGALCFRGTRVTMTVLLGELSEGMGVDEFVENYPTVPKEGVETVLRWLAMLMARNLGVPEDGSVG